MRQENLAAAEVFFQPCLTFFCKRTIAGSMIVLHNGPGNVKKFFAGNKGLIERNLDFIVHN